MRARLMVINAGTRFLQNRHGDAIDWARRAEVEALAPTRRTHWPRPTSCSTWPSRRTVRAEKAVYSARALALYEELGDLGTRR